MGQLRNYVEYTRHRTKGMGIAPFFVGRMKARYHTNRAKKLQIAADRAAEAAERAEEHLSNVLAEAEDLRDDHVVAKHLLRARNLFVNRIERRSWSKLTAADRNRIKSARTWFESHIGEEEIEHHQISAVINQLESIINAEESEIFEHIMENPNDAQGHEDRILRLEAAKWVIEEDYRMRLEETEEERETETDEE